MTSRADPGISLLLARAGEYRYSRADAHRPMRERGGLRVAKSARPWAFMSDASKAGFIHRQPRSSPGCLAGASDGAENRRQSGMGVEVIVIAFAVVVVGGLRGSIAGALLGAIIISLARSVAAHLAPELGDFAWSIL